jgi:NADP-dependent 3-hydroxy acid dehydrogenase YdfG
MEEEPAYSKIPSNFDHTTLDSSTIKSNYHQTQEWREMIDINLLGLMYATHAVLPLMKAQGSGHIVNISSLAGRVAREGLGVYSATKFGVVSFSEALRQEVSHQHIRVTVIEPGAVASEMQEHVTEQAAKDPTLSWLRSITPLASADIAAAIAYAITQPAQVDVNELLIQPVMA